MNWYVHDHCCQKKESVLFVFLQCSNRVDALLLIMLCVTLKRKAKRRRRGAENVRRVRGGNHFNLFYFSNETIAIQYKGTMSDSPIQSNRFIEVATDQLICSRNIYLTFLGISYFHLKM